MCCSSLENISQIADTYTITLPALPHQYGFCKYLAQEYAIWNKLCFFSSLEQPFHIQEQTADLSIEACILTWLETTVVRKTNYSSHSD